VRQWGVHDLPAHQRTHHRSHRGADDGADECADQRAGEPFTAMVAATPTSTAATSTTVALAATPQLPPDGPRGHPYFATPTTLVTAAKPAFTFAPVDPAATHAATFTAAFATALRASYRL